MFHNHNETELLTLMLNRKKFIQYITHQYNRKGYCTPLETCIWAVHFNVPKCQRLPLLENIIHQCMAHVRQFYSFLPEKQILGKTYEILGIPTVFGQPNKWFLNTYKKYKSYYPIKYPKDEKRFTLHHNFVDNDLVETMTSPEYSHGYSTPTNNTETICSTPITEQIPSFQINPLLSPIQPSIKDCSHILLIDSFLRKYHNLSAQNNINQNTQKLTNILEPSEYIVHKTLNQSFYDLQNTDATETENMNSSKSQMYFINKDSEEIWANNVNSNLDINSSNSQPEIFIKNNTNDNDISVGFSTEKNIKYRKISYTYKKKSSKFVFKKRLRKKFKKNFVQGHTKLKRVNQEIKSHLKFNFNDSWTRIKQSFEVSFSDLDTTELTPTIKNSQNNYQSNNKHDLEQYWREQNRKRWITDLGLQSDNSGKNIIIVDSFSNINSLSNVHSNNTSLTIDEDNVFVSNLTQKINFVKSNLIKRSQDRSNISSNNSNYYRIANQISDDSNFEETSHSKHDITTAFVSD